MRVRLAIARHSSRLWCAGFLLLASAARADELSTSELRDWGFYNNAGWIYISRGDYIQAELRFHAAIKAVRRESAKDPRLLARSYHDLALVLYYQKRYAEAEPMAAWSLDAREKNPRVKSDAIFQSVYVLGLIHAAQKHHADAERLFKRAIDLQEAALGPEHEAVVPAYDNLASVYRDQGKFADAEPLYKRAIAILEQDRPDGNSDLAKIFDHYAVILRKMNRVTEAEAVEARAKSIRDTIADAEQAAQRDAEAKAKGSNPGFHSPAPPRAGQRP